MSSLSPLNGNVDRVANSAALKLLSGAMLIVMLPILGWLATELWSDTKRTREAVISIQGDVTRVVFALDGHEKRIDRIERQIDGGR